MRVQRLKFCVSVGTAGRVKSFRILEPPSFLVARELALRAGWASCWPLVGVPE